MKTFFIWISCILLALGVPACDSPSSPEVVEQSYLHVRASWAPDGVTIAFLATVNGVSGIYVVDSSGSNRRLVYNGDTGGPSWSPDSKWLVFSQGQNLFKVKSTGDSLTQLTSAVQDIRPSWSRDGKTIAFERQTGIFLLDLASGSTRLLTDLGYYPTWHPNGLELVVLDPFVPPSYGFYAVRTDSGATRLLYSYSTQAYSSFPSMNVNAREIIFSLVPGDNYTQIWKVDVQTAQVLQLTSDGGDYAAWSPNGSKIVYTRTLRNDGALWIMNTDGSNKHRLTSP